MKTFEITKEQILELANTYGTDTSTCLRSNLTTYLKCNFPEAFETELEVGKWLKYKHSSTIIYRTGNTSGYGINSNGDWEEYDNYTFEKRPKDWRLATEQEVKTALTDEFFRKVKIGNTVKCLNGLSVDIRGKMTFFESSTNTLLLQDDCFRFELFKDGKWAEIISEPIELTLEQIAEKFNVNVEQLKIKK